MEFGCAVTNIVIRPDLHACGLTVHDDFIVQLKIMMNYLSTLSEAVLHSC